jgi:hypothetical protein
MLAVKGRCLRDGSAKPLQTIAIGGAWSWYFLSSDYYADTGEGKRVALDLPAGRNAALRNLGQRIKTLILSGKHVVFVLDNPLSDVLDPATGAIRLTGASVVDPYDAVCSQNICRVTTQTGQPMYVDQGHFNPAWAIDNAVFIDATVAR